MQAEEIYTAGIENGNGQNIIKYNHADGVMTKDIRRVSDEMLLNSLRGFAIVEGSAVIILTGAELWGPALGLATEKSIELDFLLSRTTNVVIEDFLLSLRYQFRNVLSVDNLIRLEMLAEKSFEYKKIYKTLQNLKKVYDGYKKAGFFSLI